MNVERAVCARLLRELGIHNSIVGRHGDCSDFSLLKGYDEAEPMNWEPISEQALRDRLKADLERMNDRQKRFWDLIQISPQKWIQEPWGNEGGGFWAIGLIGRTVVWYNDIENGFDYSNYQRIGEIREYLCNQYDLAHVVCRLISSLEY